MQVIAPTTPIHSHTEYVRLQRLVEPVQPDGAGSYVEDWEDLNPPFVFAAIAPAAGEQERVTPGLRPGVTVTAQAGFEITFQFHPQVTNKTRILDDQGRIFQVTGVKTIGNLRVETVCSCELVVP